MNKILRFFYRFFIDPCYGCKRHGNCELYDMRHKFCGDWTANYWEGGGEDD